MNVLEKESEVFHQYINTVEQIISNMSHYAKKEDIVGLQNLITNFRIKTDDFYRKNRKLNIGVVGQVKAGKSSFLNTCLVHQIILVICKMEDIKFELQ